ITGAGADTRRRPIGDRGQPVPGHRRGTDLSGRKQQVSRTTSIRIRARDAPAPPRVRITAARRGYACRLVLARYASRAMSPALAHAPRHRGSPHRLALILGAPTILFLVVLFAYPMLRLLAFSVENGNLQYYEQALTDGLYLEVMWRTFKLAGIVTLLALLLGYPIAHFLATAPR